MGEPGAAIAQIVGQFVLLDVVVKTEQTVPTVEILIPSELANASKPPHHAIPVHLVTFTTQGSELKQGERYRIEGIIVDEGYGAFMIYMSRAHSLK